MEIYKKSIVNMWSDNWWIENDKSWFVDGMHNILCCLDLKTNECEFMVEIPGASSSQFRLTPKCMKCGPNVFCMPDVSDDIWIYNVISQKFSKISIGNPDKVRLSVYHFWQFDDEIFAVSVGLKQIIEIDIKGQKINKHYDICCEGGISQSLRYGMSIYSLANTANEIYQFNMMTKENAVYKLPNIGRKLHAFCFDGEKFWLSGYSKEIYIWDKGKNTIKILNSFPERFGIYNFAKDTDGDVDCVTDRYETPTFWHSVSVGGKVWFVPYQTNQIIYVDRESYGISAFEIDEEIETKESILSRTSLFYKYILEYIADDRYLGLFSLKNNCILEIDTLEGNVKKKEYTFSDGCIREMLRIYKVVLHESNMLDQQFFEMKLSGCNEEAKGKGADSVGANIYRAVGHPL